MSDRIVFVGGGAVGSYVAANFARNGIDCVIVDPWEAQVNAMQSELDVRGMTSEECFQIKLNAFTPQAFEQQFEARSFDVAFIAMKSYDTQWSARFIEPYLAEDGLAVSLQNCINEPAIAEVVGESRTAGCIASTITVQLMQPGLVERNVPRRGDSYTVFRCGPVAGEPTARIHRIVEWLNTVDSAKATNNLTSERWTKLIVNAARNGLLASSGIDTKTMESEQMPRRLCIRLTAEAIRVAQAMDIPLQSITGAEPAAWLAADAGEAAALEQIESMMLADAAKRRGNTQLSMGQDIAKKRRTEIDYINGLVVSKAKALGLTAPANAMIQQAVQLVESGHAQSREFLEQAWNAAL